MVLITNGLLGTAEVGEDTLEGTWFDGDAAAEGAVHDDGDEQEHPRSSRRGWRSITTCRAVLRNPKSMANPMVTTAPTTRAIHNTFDTLGPRSQDADSGY